MAFQSTTMPADAFAFSRQFEVPREFLFTCWSSAERLMHWWGPADHGLRVQRFDFRPSGVFHYAVLAPDGTEAWHKLVYHQITWPDRLVFVTSRSDARGGRMSHPALPAWPLQVLHVVTFAQNGGATVLTMHAVPHEAADAEQTAFAAGHEAVRADVADAFARLDASLPTL